MTRINNLKRGTLADTSRRLRAVETGTPNNSGSIGAGGLRVHSGGVITIENGGLKVPGTAEIIGSLIASGPIQFDGPVNIPGPFIIEGTTDITGPITVDGASTFNGDVTSTGDFTHTGPLNIDG